MATTELLDELRRELKDALQSAKMPVEYARQASELREINVYEQYIPADLFEVDNYYPCVVVEWLQTKDLISTGTLITIGLSVGVYAKESDGWKDAFHLMELIRLRLLSRRVLGKKFRLENDVTWTPAEQQPTPFFFCYAELEYQTLQIQEEMELI